jgi:DNA topoisomerase VI subunit B
MSAEQRLDRVLFETSRAAEYFSVTELQAQTGQPVERFADVVLKELLDNAVDACETGGVAPQVSIVVRRTDGTLHVEVQDNAAGLPPQTIARILNFQTRTSDKAAYRAPTRGAQGNALKTVLGMPCALGGDAPITIEACGMRHAIRAWIDPAGELRLTHDQVPAPGCVGTCVSVALPAAPLTASDPHHLARAVALFNPHVAVRIHLVGVSSMRAC